MKISLTRLLNEIKLANKKIDKKINQDIKYFDILENSKTKSYNSIEDMKSKVDSHLKSIEDLIDQRDKYKDALLKANNTTTLVVNNTTMTIAECLAKKETIQQEIVLINTMKSQLNNIERSVGDIEYKNKSKLEELLVTAMGNDSKNAAKEISDISEAFAKNNKVSVADPSGAKSFITKKEEELEDFMNNIDFTLSEINAETKVEI